jgi:hypothetical protein
MYDHRKEGAVKMLAVGGASGLTDLVFGRFTRGLRVARDIGKVAPRILGGKHVALSYGALKRAAATSRGKKRIAKTIAAGAGGYYINRGGVWLAGR